MKKAVFEYFEASIITCRFIYQVILFKLDYRPMLLVCFYELLR